MKTIFSLGIEFTQIKTSDAAHKIATASDLDDLNNWACSIIDSDPDIATPSTPIEEDARRIQYTLAEEAKHQTLLAIDAEHQSLSDLAH